MSEQRFRLVMTGPGSGRVFLDDAEVDGVVSVGLRVNVGESNRVILMLAPAQIEIEGDFEVVTE